MKCMIYTVNGHNRVIDVDTLEKIVKEIERTREERRFVEVSCVLDPDGKKKKKVYVNPDFIAEVSALQ